MYEVFILLLLLFYTNIKTYKFIKMTFWQVAPQDILQPELSSAYIYIYNSNVIKLINTIK